MNDGKIELDFNINEVKEFNNLMISIREYFPNDSLEVLVIKALDYGLTYLQERD